MRNRNNAVIYYLYFASPAKLGENSLSPPYRPVLLEFPRACDQPFFRRPSSQVSLDSSTSSCTHLEASSRNSR